MTADAILKLLGQRIRTFREAKGWSQEELAQRCGRHFTYIGRVERGQQNITVEVLNDIGAALSIPITELLSEEVHPLLSKWKTCSLDIIQAVSHGFRAQVDIKGKLAEWMLYKELNRLKDMKQIQEITWMDADSKPDFTIKVGRKEYIIECKNVRSPTAKNRDKEPIRVEIQKTRNAADGSNTRGYRTDHFDVLAACLFNRTGNWDFLYIASSNLQTRPEDPTCLKVMHMVPERPIVPWRASIMEAIKDRGK